MSYTFTTFDGSTKTFTIADQAVDGTQIPLTFFGRGAVNYGQSFAQNLVFHLENFASPTSTALNALKPVRGQLWFNTTLNRLMVNINPNTPTWQQVGGATVSSSAPVSPLTGDFWYDATNNQLRVYNGTSFILVGPAAKSVTAPLTPSLGDTWFNTQTNQLEVWNGSVWIVIGPSNANPLNVETDTIVASAQVVFRVVNGNIITALTDSTVSNNNLPATVTLQGTAYNLQSRFSGGFKPGLNVTTASGFVINATAITAEYGDLAERYHADEVMYPGDVVDLGGIAEITKTKSFASDKVFGVISTRPGLRMNDSAGSDETHPFVAFAGRVPCKVKGRVNKGDRLMSSGFPGIAIVADRMWPQSGSKIIGRALADKMDDDVGLVEIVIGAK